MDLELTGKTAIVTGAGRGLGRAIALALAGEGTSLALADTDLAAASETAELAGDTRSRAIALKSDVSSASEVKEMIEGTIAEFGTIDILVNNAGICPRRPLSEIDEAEWNRVMDVNLKGAFLCSQSALPVMKHNKYGRIINMASAAAYVGGIGVGAHYAASKAALVCLTKSLAQDAASFGVTANAVAPGVIDTDITRDAGTTQVETYKNRIPLGRIGEPADVAGLVLFLASGRSSYITGQTFGVNGGLIMP